MKIHIDGQLLDEADAKISVFDHGLLYGDGVFEGIRIYHGRVFKLEEHMDRLYDSARVICLEIPVSKEQMTADLLATIRANDLRDGYVRLVVTRGVGDLGINPRLCPKASIIIIAAKIKLYSEELYQRGLDIITCATRRMSQAALPPAVKSLNYLNNIMAKIEAHQANAAEALMLNEQGYIAECTADNVFIIKRGTLYTPPVSAGSLRGITRGAVLDIAAEIGVPRRDGADPLRHLRGRRVFPDRHRGGTRAGGQRGLASGRRRQARASDCAPAGWLPPFDIDDRNADFRGRKRLPSPQSPGPGRRAWRKAPPRS